MKTVISTVCLASGLLMAGMSSFSIAQPMHQMRPGGAPAAQNRLMDPVAAAQTHLAELKQKLNLKPNQQAAWETYSNAMIAQAKSHAQSGGGMESMRRMHGLDTENIPTAEKMEKMAAVMRTNADLVSKMAAATKTFYAGLSVEQKTIFDLFSKMQWHRRMMEHMHYGDMD